jgi:probable F420-dependent oxidoreductase
MKFGTGLPMAALPDFGALRDFSQGLEDGGFDYVQVGGHVLSQPTGTYPDFPAPFYSSPFNAFFITLSLVAAVTRRIHLLTGVLILPSWPTALVAKQAAELAVFSGGRFELGVGISWNKAEYQALGQDARTRGRRIEEQVEVLRLLWSSPFVTYEGRYHKLENIGLGRIPPAPIPVLFGTGTDEKILRRVAHLADGWIPVGPAAELIPKLREYVAAAGRDPSSLSYRTMLPIDAAAPDATIAAARKLKASGVTHLTLMAPMTLPPPQALKSVIEARKILADALG